MILKVSSTSYNKSSHYLKNNLLVLVLLFSILVTDKLYLGRVSILRQLVVELISENILFKVSANLENSLH